MYVHKFLFVCLSVTVIFELKSGLHNDSSQWSFVLAFVKAFKVMSRIYVGGQKYCIKGVFYCIGCRLKLK